MTVHTADAYRANQARAVATGQSWPGFTDRASSPEQRRVKEAVTASRDEGQTIRQAAPQAQGMTIAARSAGWWWPFQDLVILTERPSIVSMDERNRLHNGSGPAVRYADGFSVYAWHGLAVPAAIIEEDPSTWTVEAILRESNQEIRRAKLERFGWERFALLHKPVQRDDYGDLYRIPIPGDDEPLVFVGVDNSTPEKDGSIKKYFLRVPPSCERAREAVAWTFGLDEASYAPAVET